MVELASAKAFEAKEPEESLRIVATTESVVPEPPNAGAPARKSAKRGAVRTGILAITLAAGAAIGVDTGYRHFVVNRYVQQTDNAYVKADFTTVAPKVSGYIKEILVEDNDTVKAGQLIARIDDRDFQIALSQAKADLESADAAIRNVDAQIALQHSLVEQAVAALNSSNAAFAFALAEADRSTKLIMNGAGTRSRAEQSASLRDQAAAAVKRDEANVIATRNKIPVLESQKDQAVAQRHRVAAQVAQAELNLSYTQIVAPVDGTIGARTLRIGQLVNAGTQLMAVVPLDAIYVVANFKETQVSDIHPAQPVTIRVDSFPGIEIGGRVESLSPGSGSEFSLLPADNATGNFTKVVQRVPVKITIDDKTLAGRLRAGMSVVPRVDTRDGRNDFWDHWILQSN
ncbi:HlyD family secretion protein [Rhizobium sp. YS-1r]|uniref:HlyD family secretion protein n=1 Tax=Rhizobium sp. YS-1r TaxID=1532558 RepID=UPI00050DA256|nr:HlyD family secretion protein [Rhizobium sp. YS-1r]KGE01322.1 hemolysin D [Rhizobium sp. YS-1r]